MVTELSLQSPSPTLINTLLSVTRQHCPIPAYQHRSHACIIVTRALSVGSAQQRPISPSHGPRLALGVSIGYIDCPPVPPADVYSFSRLTIRTSSIRIHCRLNSTNRIPQSWQTSTRSTRAMAVRLRESPRIRRGARLTASSSMMAQRFSMLLDSSFGLDETTESVIKKYESRQFSRPRRQQLT